MPCRRLLSVLILLCLVGCTGLPESMLPAAAGGSPAAASTSDPQPENPYLVHRPPVDEAAARRFAAANAAMAAADPATARAELEWLVEYRPGLSGPYLNLALLHQAEANDPEAELYFQAAIEVNASNLAAYNQYGIFLRQQGRFEEAEAVYLAALTVWDGHAASHRNLGVLYDLYRGDSDKALFHYRRYQALTDGEDRAVAGWIVDLERRYGQVVGVVPQ